MFKAVVGHGLDPDSEGAVQEALEQCAQALAGAQPKAGILFAAIDFDHEVVLREVRRAYPDILLVGGTSAGEMSSAMGFQEDSLALMLFCSDEVDFRVGVGKQAERDAIAATRAAMSQVSADSQAAPIKLCYVLSDGLCADAVEIANELRRAANGKFPIVGGLTGDDVQFKSNYQFVSTPERTEVLQGAVVALAFSGNLKVSYSVASGQRPIGTKGTVTKSEGKTIYEIDGQPTKEFYVGALGTPEVRIAGGSWSGALAVYEADDTDFYVRSPSGQNPADGSVQYFGHISSHSTVQLVESDRDSLLFSVKQACQTALAAYPGEKPAVALLVSCAARLKALGTQTGQEYTLTSDCFGKEMPLIGFHSFGEISPFTQQTATHFHNETFVALLLGTH